MLPWIRTCGNRCLESNGKGSLFIENNERMIGIIKALSGGLAEVVPDGDNNETVQIVHQSVNDFLRTKGPKVLVPYCWPKYIVYKRG